MDPWDNVVMYVSTKIYKQYTVDGNNLKIILFKKMFFAYKMHYAKNKLRESAHKCETMDHQILCLQVAMHDAHCVHILDA